ncbi:16S rRNA (cytidine(1402)-2'-O)-methyltransferase [Alicyclobacillus dauci]|uniref:Ribosomal RNA small subunit methyltransferase I n=1 Tax=Alicyclobacillus dauci TaxID=1475485 RepID=A0ABY6Z350_9BACL|nr:16S rRNA (cytidine(1402)-2'-O)-methyltransferase [Alicyclobacillus dauci]WAH37313.1 16S rRNA (cytidine(1402)-2'-O)-methyltransferase [Alicyclobacillus dauci]
MVRVRKNNVDEGPKLYVCSTPIGNLSDTSDRLLSTLRSVDIVACEDTRHTRKLLTHFDIHPPRVISYHQHNEQSRQEFVMEMWDAGQSVALVSDAGTPLLSDPGAILVDTAIERGVPVIPIPGPSALMAALVGSGLPMTPFLYLGFPPRQTKAAKSWLGDFVNIQATLVIYEAPHRLTATLQFLADALGDKPAVLAKELTKQHETFVWGSLVELVSYSNEVAAKGEYVILVNNRGERVTTGTDADAGTPGEDAWEQAVQYVVDKIEQGMRHKEAVQEAAARFAVNRRDLYNATIRTD